MLNRRSRALVFNLVDQLSQVQPYFSQVELRVLAAVALGLAIPRRDREALAHLQVAGLVTDLSPPGLTREGVTRLLSFL